MQVQPPCQAQGAAAAAAAAAAAEAEAEAEAAATTTTTAVLVVSAVKVVWARGSGQALGESAGEAGVEKTRSALAQRQKCCRSTRMSLERGAFEAQYLGHTV